MDVSGYVADLKPGATARVEVWRKGASRELTVTVGEMKPQTRRFRRVGRRGSGQAGRCGARADAGRAEGSRHERRRAGRKRDGAAAQAGLQRGDIILALNNTPVKDPEQLRGIVAKSGKHVALLVQREDTKVYIPVDLG